MRPVTSSTVLYVDLSSKIRTASTYPSAATIWSPTITSDPRFAFRVEELMRSSLTRVVTTTLLLRGRCRDRTGAVAGGALRTRARREERRHRGDTGEGPRLVTGPEAVLLAVGRHGRVHH